MKRPRSTESKLYTVQTGLQGLASLFAAIYQSGKDLHAVDTDGVASLLDLLAEEMDEALGEIKNWLAVGNF